jgi:hypothetical protein
MQGVDSPDAWFGRRPNPNGEGIREIRAVIFRPAHFDDPAGFKGYFYKTGLEVRMFGSGLRYAQDRINSFDESRR